MARVLPHLARATRRRPHRLAGVGAAAVFSLTLVSGIVAPGVAGAAPIRTAPGQVPNGSNGVNHNDPPPTTPQCTSGPCTGVQPLSTADKTNNGANSNTPSTNPYASTRHGLPSDNGSGTGLATGRPCAACVGKADNKNPQGQAPNGPSDHNNGYECDGNNGIGQTNPAHTGCTGTTTGGGTGGGGGGSCTPTTANNDCGTGTGGGTCTPTAANNNCGTGTGGGTCTPTPANHECDTSPGGGGGCTPTTAGCTPPACSASGPSAGSCSPASVLALQGSRLPSAPAPTPSSLAPATLAADGLAAAPAALASPAPPAAVASRVLGASGARSLPFTGVDLDALLLAAVGLLMGGAAAQAVGRRPRARRA